MFNHILYVIITFRLRDVELLIDDQLVSKTLSDLQHYRWPTLYFLGWNDLQYLDVCNDCETMKSGKSVKFVWRNPESSPAELLSVWIQYRIPGKLNRENESEILIYIGQG